MTIDEVIKGLECCMLSYKDGCDECPYIGKGMCQELLGEHALALLKEQEAKRGMPIHSAWIGDETCDAYDIAGVKTWAVKRKCRACGFTHKFIEAHMCYAYCPGCGAKMIGDDNG